MKSSRHGDYVNGQVAKKSDTSNNSIKMQTERLHSRDPWKTTY